MIVVSAFISPYRVDRAMAQSVVGAEYFIEVHVATPLEVCEKRDPKGLYAKARRGELKNFTGIDSDYEPPESPDLHLQTIGLTAETCVDEIGEALH